MRILGIDPGTIRLGYGLIDKSANNFIATDYGTLSFRQKLPIEDRLYQIYSHLSNMISMYNPDDIAVEEPFLGRGENQFVGPALAIGQAQAAVLIAAVSHGVPIFRYSPTQIKSSLADHGAASKDQVKTMVKLALSIDEDPDSTDATDALATALCHARHKELADLIKEKNIS